MIPASPAAVAPNTPAQRCQCCRRALPSGHGTHVLYVGVVGPECVKKFTSLINALNAVDGLEAYEHDQGSIRLAHHVIHDLRRAGVAVKCVEVRAGVKAVQIVGLSSKPSAVVQHWAKMREAFEARLRLAAAERQAQDWVAA